MSTPNTPFDSLPEPTIDSAAESGGAERPVWGLLDVLLIAIFFAISLGVLTVVAFIIIHAVPALRHYTFAQLAQEPLAILPPQTASYLCTLFFMMLVIRRGSDGPFWDAVKWNWPSNTFFVLIAGGLVMSLAVQLLSSYLPIPKELPIDQFFKTTRAAWLLAIFGIFIAPFFEELFFRGFLYPALYRRTGFIAAVVINSAIFALFHEGQLAHAWAPLLVLFIVGIILTLVRAKRQSVASSFLVHAAYNGFLFASIFVVTGGFRHMEKLR